MTEKRFSFNWERGHPNFWDNYCDLADCYLTCEDVVELLNELHKENEQLKSDLDYFKAKNGSLETGMFNLGRENEQLKNENAKMKKELSLLAEFNQKAIL